MYRHGFTRGKTPTHREVTSMKDHHDKHSDKNHKTAYESVSEDVEAVRSKSRGYDGPQLVTRPGQ